MVAKLILRALDHIFVLRPLILMPAWSFYLLGARESFKEQGIKGISLSAFPAPATFLALTSILITAYLLNQIFDRETDKLNKKVFFLAEGMFSVRRVLILAIIFFFLASFLFHRIQAGQRLILVLALILSLIYSLPPLRLCTRPFLDLAANATGYGGLAFVLGYSIGGSSPLRGMILSIPYVLLVAGTFIHTTLLDLEGDEKTGKRTTGVFLGESVSEKVALVMTAAAFTSSIIIGNLFATAVTVPVVVLAILEIRARTRRARALLVQASTLVVTLAAVSAWPSYFILIFPLAVMARKYYAARFGIIYPGVSEDS